MLIASVMSRPSFQSATRARTRCGIATLIALGVVTFIACGPRSEVRRGDSPNAGGTLAEGGTAANGESGSAPIGKGGASTAGTSSSGTGGASGSGTAGTLGETGGDAGAHNDAGASGDAGTESGGTTSVLPACQQLLLHAPLPTFEVGTRPSGVTAGDFNRDGWVDLATANSADATTSVLLGNGEGIFRDRVDFDTHNFPHAIASAFVDGDDHLDLITSNADTLSVLIGSGDGTFTRILDFDTPGGEALFVADLNHDEHLDVVHASLSAVTIFIGSGNGDFALRGLVGDSLRLLGIADVNGDDELDLVMNGGFLPGLGDGDVGDAVAVGSELSAFGDFDSDGDVDLLAPGCDGSADGEPQVLLGVGDGDFGAPIGHASGHCLYDVTVADVNGDSNLDLIGHEGHVRLGTGDGGFGPEIGGLVAPGEYLGLHDWNNDGFPDIAHAIENSVSLRLGKGDGTFRDNLRFEAVSAGNHPRSVTLADFDLDDIFDIAVADQNLGTINVLRGSGNGSFEPRVEHPSGHHPETLLALDLNHDSRADVVSLSASESSISVSQATSVGFDTPSIYAAPEAATGLDVTYDDDDPELDILVSSSLGTLDVRLGPSFTTLVETALATYPSALIGGDFDRDRRVDAVTVDTAASTVSVLMGTGDGSFGPERQLPTGPGPVEVLIAEISRDTEMDIITVNKGSVSVLLGAGKGEFHPHYDYVDLPFIDPRHVTWGDLNFDGFLDLVITGSGSFTVLLGSGGGTFSCHQTYAVDDFTDATAVSDVNGDDHHDVVTTIDNSVTVFVNAL